MIPLMHARPSRSRFWMSLACGLSVAAVTPTLHAAGTWQKAPSSATNGGPAEATSTFRLTREMLEKGICLDLDRGEDDRREFQRRANEAALLLRAAGVDVKLEL